MSSADRDFIRICVWTVLWLAGVAILAFFMPVKAQSTNAPTQNWFITRRGSEINIIDTGGVCLYVTAQGGVAAVQKTQLPAGEGCE